jgi:tetratricopeptide (TPR) repeat protein
MPNNNVYQSPTFVRENIVKIVDYRGTFYGTGFFIELYDEIFCVTCHHCIYNLNEIFFEKDNKKYPCKWIETYSDMRQDISVLKPIDINVSVKPLKNNLQMLPGLKVFLWGFSSTDLLHFPSGSLVENSFLSQDYIPFYWPNEKSIGSNPWNLKPEVTVNVHQFNGKIDLGFSGAPVCYDGDKKVIGIFTAKDNNYGYVIPIETLLSKFKKDTLLTPYSNKDVKDLLERGNKYYYKREYDKALLCYDEIIKDSNYLSALSYRGRADVQLGRTKKAIDLFNLVLSLDPNFIFALIGMGIAVDRLGKNEESIVWYDKAIAINPNDVDALVGKGLAFYRLGNIEEAIVWYDKAIAINPNFANALNNKGLALDRLGKQEAIVWYDKALAINLNDTYALNNKGLAFYRLGNIEEAIVWYDKAIASNPNYTNALNNKGLALDRLGKNEESIVWYDKARAIKQKLVGNE